MFESKSFLCRVKIPYIKIQKHFWLCHFNGKSHRKGSFTNIYLLGGFLVQPVVSCGFKTSERKKQTKRERFPGKFSPWGRMEPDDFFQQPRFASYSRVHRRLAGKSYLKYHVGVWSMPGVKPTQQTRPWHGQSPITVALLWVIRTRYIQRGQKQHISRVFS